MKKLLIPLIALVLLGAGCQTKTVTNTECVEYENIYYAHDAWGTRRLGTDYGQTKEMLDGDKMAVSKQCVKYQNH